jgi:hypothetical protein
MDAYAHKILTLPDAQVSAATALTCLMDKNAEGNAMAAHGLKKLTANELAEVQEGARKLMLLTHVHLSLGEHAGPEPTGPVAEG